MESNELVNFLEPKLGPSVKSSCITDDLYPVENLISSDRQKSQLGFMAYRVVKPPIELHFTLMCRIELCAIKMWTQIDSLKSTGFEIHVNGDDASREYHKIGSYFNLKENSLQFVNDQYSSPGYECDASITSAPLYPSTRIHMRKVKNIKVCIKQSNRSCVPVLKRIEVWGKVSIFERNEQQHKQIARLISQTPTAEAVQMYGCPTTNENTPHAPTIDESMNSNQVDVPEAFLDTITYEIMALPMILPSGKVIDNASLMKHNSEEEKWGRLPSDPFTGQIFTDKRKPILDVRLKSQIDTFLLKNCNRSDVSSVPRTVGTSMKRKNDQVTEYTHAQDSIKLNRRSDSSTTDKPAISGNVSNQATSSRASSSYTISNCLDNTVQNILRTRKYTKASTNNEERMALNNCYQCQTNHESHSNSLYIIRLCSHLICRACLVDGKIKLCRCGREFSNFHIRKYHMTREI